MNEWQELGSGDGGLNDAIASTERGPSVLHALPGERAPKSMLDL